MHMELVKLQKYFRVERTAFLDEHFYSRQHFMYLTERGSYSYTIGGQTFYSHELDCVFYKKGSWYDRKVLSPAVIHIFDLDQAFWDSDAPVSFGNRQRICSTLALLNSIEGKDPKHFPFIEHLLNDILYTFQQERDTGAGAEKDKRIEQALDILQSRKDMSVNELAKAVHLSYPQFNRLFARHMNVTPIQYIHQLKAEKAKELLYTTDLPVKAVAAECGFRDIYYFSNFFKAMTGVSPTRYRNGRSEP